MFEFSKNYKEIIGGWAVVIWFCSLVVFGISVIPDSPKPETFVTSVSETNQPNCVVGAYIMFANERRHDELLIGWLQKTYPVLSNSYVKIGAIKKVWDEMYPSNKLICTYDCSNEDSFTNKPAFGKPYLWVGKWGNDTNEMYHACLMYFHPDSVTFKHFVYNPKTDYNYFVKTNYQFFFNNTLRLYQIK